MRRSPVTMTARRLPTSGRPSSGAFLLGLFRVRHSRDLPYLQVFSSSIVRVMQCQAMPFGN
jgi:hypothetical protein